MTDRTPEEALRELDITLPVVTEDPKYTSWRPSGPGLIFVAGQLPYRDGVLPRTGAVGDAVDVEAARDLMRTATINALAVASQATGGIGRLRIVQMLALVASAPGFGGQSNVADAGSELLVEVLGERGRHARTAIGVAALPRTSPVEVQLVVEVAQ